MGLGCSPAARYEDTQPRQVVIPRAATVHSERKGSAEGASGKDVGSGVLAYHTAAQEATLQPTVMCSQENSRRQCFWVQPKRLRCLFWW
jgi:hypothetical protein